MCPDSFQMVIYNFPTWFRNDIEWMSSEALQELKSRRRLFAYSMNSALDGIRLMKQRLYEEPKSSVVFQDIVKLSRYKNTRFLSGYSNTFVWFIWFVLICSLIFLRGLSHYTEMAEFDASSSVTAVECFSEIFSLISTHYNSKVPQFLEECRKFNFT